MTLKFSELKPDDLLRSINKVRWVSLKRWPVGDYRRPKAGRTIWIYTIPGVETHCAWAAGIAVPALIVEKLGLVLVIETELISERLAVIK